MRLGAVIEAGPDRAAIPTASPSFVRTAVGVLALALAYWGAAQLGYALDFAGPVAAIVWLPVGVGISFLYLGGLRLWPGVLLGDLLANDYAALPVGLGARADDRQRARDARRDGAHAPPAARRAPLGQRARARADARRPRRRDDRQRDGRHGCRCGSAASSTAAQMPDVWRTWWLGDFTGALVVVPLAIAWVRPVAPDGWSGGRHRGGAGRCWPSPC